MASWTEFAAAAPELAAEGRRLIYRTDTGEALLATVRHDEPPRIHPIYVGIIDDRLYAFITNSPKRRDLAEDGRYALHTHQDPAVPREFAIRGRATLVGPGDIRTAVAGQWYFEPDDSYDLFEFFIDSALVGLRDDPDEWPPRYTTWTPS